MQGPCSPSSGRASPFPERLPGNDRTPRRPSASGYNRGMRTSTLRAGLYERVSTGIQDSAESRSVDQQNRAGQSACDERGWPVKDRYPDPGLSASRFARRGRPEWTRLVADIEARRLDVVVMWASNRGGRELEEWARFLNACRKNSVRIFVVSESRLYDLAIARDWKSLAEDGIDSAYDSEKISINARRGIADSVARGEPTGRIPFGYTRRYELDPTRPKGKRAIQVPDVKESPVVREIIERIARNEAVSAILRDFAARGETTRAGKPWSRSSLTRLVLEGVVYIGKRRHNGSALQAGEWPPVVEPETYWRAVAVLSDPARKPKGSGIRPGRARWLLSYVAACGVCGGPLSMRHLPRSSGQTAYYRCARGCVSAPVAWLDEMATVGVVGFCSTSPLYEVLTRADDKEAQAARAEAQAERDKLAEFEEQAISGAISAASFARISARLEAQITELEARATELSAPPALRDLVSSAATQEERWEDIHARWRDMPLTAKRGVVSAIFAPVLYPANGDPSDRSRFRMPLDPRWEEK
jgi:site-specific DNA recombinase